MGDELDNNLETLTATTSVPATSSNLETQMESTAEVTQYLISADEEEERSKAQLEEEKRFKVSKRAMGDSIAEQEELIQQHAEKLLKQSKVIKIHEQEILQTEAQLKEAIEAKNKQRLEKRLNELKIELARQEAVQETTQVEAVAYRSQLKDMIEEKKLATLDENERLRQAAVRTARLKNEEDQYNLIMKNKEKIRKNKEALILQEKEAISTNKQLQEAIAAKDEAAKERMKKKSDELNLQIIAKKKQLKIDRQRNLERREEIILQAKERALQDIEEAQRQQLAAYRRSQVIAAEEQREYILRNERKRIAWETEMKVKIHEQKLHEVAYKKAVKEKDEKAMTRIKSLRDELLQQIQIKQQQVSEAAAAIREKRELLQHEERERKQQAAENRKLEAYKVLRRQAEIKRLEFKKFIESKREKESQMVLRQQKAEEENQKSEEGLKLAVANKDEATIARLKKLQEKAQQEILQIKIEKDTNAKEITERRELLVKHEKERVKAEAKEAERMRNVQKRRAESKKEEEQIKHIMANRKKNQRALDRINTIENGKKSKEDDYRRARRRRSILGNERVKEQRKQVLQKAQDKKAVKEAKKLEAQRRREEIKKSDDEARKAKAREIEEKDRKAKARLKEMNASKNPVKIGLASGIVGENSLPKKPEIRSPEKKNGTSRGGRVINATTVT
jgi:hypothetical protein